MMQDDEFSFLVEFLSNETMNYSMKIFVYNNNEQNWMANNERVRPKEPPSY